MTSPIGWLIPVLKPRDWSHRQIDNLVFSVKKLEDSNFRLVGTGDEQ